MILFISILKNLEPKVNMSKKTLEGTNRKAVRKSGFRARIRTANGRKIIKQRRKKGRKSLSLSDR